MPKKKTKTNPGLPLERHREIGAELYTMRHRLLAIAAEIQVTHAKDSTEASRPFRVVEALDSMRSALDDLACRLPGGGPEVYYPGGASQ